MLLGKHGPSPIKSKPASSPDENCALLMLLQLHGNCYLQTVEKTHLTLFYVLKVTDDGFHLEKAFLVNL